MKKLIVIGFLLSRLAKDMHGSINSHENRLSSSTPEEHYNTWPGKLDTVETNIFQSKLRRRLSY